MATIVYDIFKQFDRKIGQDVFISGFNNSYNSTKMDPGLTSINADPALLSYQAVVLANQDSNFQYVVPTKLIKRKSIGHYENKENLVSDFIDYWSRNDLDVAYLVSGLQSIVFSSSFLISEQLLGDFASLFEAVLKIIYTNTKEQPGFKKITGYLTSLLTSENIPLMDVNLFVAIFASLCEVAKRQKPQAMEMCNRIFSAIIDSLDRLLANEKQERYGQMRRMNSFQHNLMELNPVNHTYSNYAQALLNIGFRDAYLFIYPHGFKSDDKLLVAAIIHNGIVSDYGNLAFTVSEIVDDCYQRARNNPKPFVVATVNYENEVNGLLICEYEQLSHDSIQFAAAQIGVSLNTLRLLKRVNSTSRHDELTGFYNRRALRQRIDIISSEPDKMGPSHLWFCDLDRLKGINDEYGHHEGDFAIRQAATILNELFPDDPIYRYGGDEFLVFLKNADIDELEARIATTIKKTNQMLNKPYRIDLSYGVVAIDKIAGHKDADELIKRVDEQMYRNKIFKRRIQQQQ